MYAEININLNDNIFTIMCLDLYFILLMTWLLISTTEFVQELDRVGPVDNRLSTD